jgi:hypothetical protein
MPKVIKNVSAEILPNYIGNVTILPTPVGLVGENDYIEIFNFVGFTQNFKFVKSLETIEKPNGFGLKNQFNIPIITLEISY